MWVAIWLHFQNEIIFYKKIFSYLDIYLYLDKNYEIEPEAFVNAKNIDKVHRLGCVGGEDGMMDANSVKKKKKKKTAQKCLPLNR